MAVDYLQELDKKYSQMGSAQYYLPIGARRQRMPDKCNYEYVEDNLSVI